MTNKAVRHFHDWLTANFSDYNNRADLSRLTGMSQSLLTAIIEGQHAPKEAEMVLIADASGHALAEICGQAHEDPDPDIGDAVTHALKTLAAVKAVEGASTPAPWSRFLHTNWIDGENETDVLAPAPVECGRYCLGGYSQISLSEADHQPAGCW